MYGRIHHANRLTAARTMPRRKIAVSILASFATLFTLQAQAGTDATVEFDSEFLVSSSGQAVDLSRFQTNGAVPPDVYEVDVFVNRDRVGRAPVRFEVRGTRSDAEPVFDQAQFELIGVAVARLPDAATSALADGRALYIDEAVEDATASFDFSELRLDLSVPQIALNRRARGYVSPEQWDRGVAAAFLGYDANVYHQDGTSSQTHGFLGLSAGANLAGWRLRHQGTYQADSTGDSRYRGTATYAEHDLTAWRSQLTVGDAFTSGELFESAGFRGLRIHSDDRMLPDSQRGYAPTVRGVASTNARVTIHQNGRLIHETVVAPGAFVIDDLYPTGYGGDLQVTIHEADGRTQAFNVPYAAVPLSLRPGRSRYSAALGQLRDPRLQDDPWFAQGTWQRGFTNRVTGYGGLTAAPGYRAAMVGGVLNGSAGAFGLDITQSHTGVPGSSPREGTSVRATYSKLVSKTGTNFSLAAYRYSTDGYFGLNEAMAIRENPDLERSLRPRSRAQVTLNQDLGEGRGQLFVTGSATDYWSGGHSDLTYTAGYSNTFGKVGVNLMATRQHDAGVMDTTYHASFSIPLGSQRPAALTSSLARGSDGTNSVQAMLSGSLDDDNAATYGLALNHTEGGHGPAQTSGSANVAYRAPSAVYAASLGMGGGFTQAAAGVRGALVAHPGGLTLSQPLSDTFGVVEAKHAAGARLLNAAGTKVDKRGYAVVPYMTPYIMNTVELDPKGLSTDVELQTTSQQVAPRAGAVTLLRYATVSGRTLVIRGRQADGRPLPFGATAYDEDGRETGIVGQASRLVARGLGESGTLTVKWGDSPSEACRIDYLVPDDRERRTDGYERIDAPCLPAYGEEASSAGRQLEKQVS